MTLYVCPRCGSVYRQGDVIANFTTTAHEYSCPRLPCHRADLVEVESTFAGMISTFIGKGYWVHKCCFTTAFDTDEISLDFSCDSNPPFWPNGFYPVDSSGGTTGFRYNNSLMTRLSSEPGMGRQMELLDSVTDLATWIDRLPNQSTKKQFPLL